MEVNIDGHKFQFGKVDVFLCGIAHPGAHPKTTPLIPKEGFDISKEMEIARRKLKKAKSDVERRGIAEEITVMIKKKYHHPIHLLTYVLGHSRSMCGGRGCIRACLAYLDQKKKLSLKFNHVFREKGQKAQPMYTYRTRASNAATQFPDTD